jgi:hypothetical protein
MSSVKFEERKTTTTNVNGGVRGGKEKEGLAHDIGEALTRGGGPQGYLAVRMGKRDCEARI